MKHQTTDSDKLRVLEEYYILGTEQGRRGVIE